MAHAVTAAVGQHAAVGRHETKYRRKKERKKEGVRDIKIYRDVERMETKGRPQRQRSQGNGAVKGG